MHRPGKPLGPQEALATLAFLSQDGFGLRVLLRYLPPGATLQDAQFLREKLKQAQRRRCSFLDEQYGIQRPPREPAP